MAFLPRASTADLLEQIELRALLYFQENAHPETGLVRDRARNFTPTPLEGGYRMASIAATGMGLAVLANAADRGLVSKDWAAMRILKTLRFVDCCLFKHKGWMYHFIDWEKGERFGNSEVSTIDTALFLAGALYAGQVFPGGDIERLAQSLYTDVDFVDMMTNGADDPKPEQQRVIAKSDSTMSSADVERIERATTKGPNKNKRTLSMGWTPETGHLDDQWDTYAEQMVMLIMGLGHPSQRLPPETWTAWARPNMMLPSGNRLIAPDLPLFVHQYSHLFVDFRRFKDAYDNYSFNSVLATLWNRKVCLSQLKQATYRAGFWGLSASGSATGYQAFSPAVQDGTVCLGCAGASHMFTPKTVEEDLNAWANGPFRKKIWGRYGFSDSLNVDKQWFDPDVIGITVASEYLSLANRAGLSAPTIWERFHEVGAIKRGLARAGLTYPR